MAIMGDNENFNIVLCITVPLADKYFCIRLSTQLYELEYPRFWVWYLSISNCYKMVMNKTTRHDILVIQQELEPGKWQILWPCYVFPHTNTKKRVSYTSTWNIYDLWFNLCKTSACFCPLGPWVCDGYKPSTLRQGGETFTVYLCQVFSSFHLLTKFTY